MSTTTQTVLLVTKSGHAEAPALAGTIASWLRARGARPRVAEHRAGQGGPGLPVDGCDLVLVLGGDGTMISVAREVAGRAPLLGLNMGRLGFLTELAPEGWEEPLARLLDRGIPWCERLGLAWDVRRGGAVVASGAVVNDLVVNRGALARLLHLTLALDGECLGRLRADGLVVATPTGSTAYSISSGGPIVHPSLAVFTVTPICPFLSNFKPMVLPGTAELRVGVEDAGTEVFLTLDGQGAVALDAGDEVRVRRSPAGIKLADAGITTYVSRLRAKGVIE
ncbi:NAD(+)/NADH kinase [Desulfocurvus sp.]|jgi:NAD+ kinase|uniref:NAD(+)/NADH kinase n=1 Tax=Desulfocurvus sp. TaxID=2871698 RepID=UPI0025C0755B|nr:NAD(+)/NADH kinase [Desulfocurvus sp.]MCK9239185.1 NAD(+)/NADH kinase [Desulfocurvus sp.]